MSNNEEKYTVDAEYVAMEDGTLGGGTVEDVVKSETKETSSVPNQLKVPRRSSR